MSPLEGLATEPRHPVPRWGMAIDLNRCVGCQTCTIACKHANNTPPGVQWRQVLDVELGIYPDVERLFLPVGCQHCDDPPCVPVCPTGATYRRADGIVAIDYEWCIGCATCSVACPYQARHLVHARDFYYRQADTRQEQAVADPGRLGVAQKCTFCMGKVDAAQARGLTPGLDLDATPACAVSCIAQAITFGDLNDPDSPVSHVLRANESFAMHEELGTKPAVRYLYQTPSIPGATRAPGDDEARDADPANALVGQLQRVWDYRAAMNFMLGGLAAGLAVAAALANTLLGLASDTTRIMIAVAAAIMALGLAFVLLKLGPTWRALYALRRPRTSWMSREVYAVGLFYPLVAAMLLWPNPALYILIAATAAAFLYCQGRILQASKGIPAWRVPMTVAMIVATGLFEGVGALLFLATALDAEIAGGPIAAGVLAVLASANAALWQLYRAEARANGIAPLARRAIAALTPPLCVVGHALPFLGALGALLWPALAPVLLAGAGLGAIVGGLSWKFVFITRIGHRQGFDLPWVPQRGSGLRAAPPVRGARI